MFWFVPQKHKEVHPQPQRQGVQSSSILYTSKPPCSYFPDYCHVCVLIRPHLNLRAKCVHQLLIDEDQWGYLNVCHK